MHVRKRPASGRGGPARDRRRHMESGCDRSDLSPFTDAGLRRLRRPAIRTVVRNGYRRASRHGERVSGIAAGGARASSRKGMLLNCDRGHGPARRRRGWAQRLIEGLPAGTACEPLFFRVEGSDYNQRICRFSEPPTQRARISQPLTQRATIDLTTRRRNSMTQDPNSWTCASPRGGLMANARQHRGHDAMPVIREAFHETSRDARGRSTRTP